ncbi:hypothetical protein [Streptomyces sp. NBC_00233]|uniref:hypothetical protein n=1 Tax=Streptomyces sp. NBC_00233 TaxID=2975686 RepID=UPI00225C2AF7|nr:hypothetical protein [Streptomyces sp. NBC_00233]MCX5232634.1 hypothetical protein [Streptomyces sp. NBC_00233]
MEQQRRIEPHPVVAGSLVCPEADEATVMARTAGEVRPQIDARAGTDEDLGSVTANDPSGRRAAAIGFARGIHRFLATTRKPQRPPLGA